VSAKKAMLHVMQIICLHL
jgi:Ca2+-binding EF-hand superfamily protein